MKIIIHDYAGHPFPVYLSRELAQRGHVVHHLYFAEDAGPKGTLQTSSEDPENLSFSGISIGSTYEKENLFSRRTNDIKYGKLLGRKIAELKPDIVISANTPTESQGPIIKACKESEAAFIYWMQDFYSIAVTKILSRKLGSLGKAIGQYYQWLDRSHLKASDSIVVITEDFCDLVNKWTKYPKKVVTIENWGVINDIPLCPRQNLWSRKHKIQKDFVYLYSGTLGLKHNPSLLADLAEHVANFAKVIVVGQGVGMKQLASLKESRQLKNLLLLPLQQFEQLANMLASADVALAMIDNDAGIFSVPSKVQSYFCAGKATLLSAPKANLAARVLKREKAGIVVDPEDKDGFLVAAQCLYDNDIARSAFGENARSYAENAYDIDKITDRFEALICDTMSTLIGGSSPTIR